MKPGACCPLPRSDQASEAHVQTDLRAEAQGDRCCKEHILSEQNHGVPPALGESDDNHIDGGHAHGSEPSQQQGTS